MFKGSTVLIPLILIYLVKDAEIIKEILDSEEDIAMLLIPIKEYSRIVGWFRGIVRLRDPLLRLTPILLYL